MAIQRFEVWDKYMNMICTVVVALDLEIVTVQDVTNGRSLEIKGACVTLSDIPRTPLGNLLRAYWSTMFKSFVETGIVPPCQCL